MTVQEATKKHIAECRERILRIKDFLENNKDANIDECKENIFVLEITIKSLEELKEAREKQIPKKPIEKEFHKMLHWNCPICEGGLFHEQQYCDECGTKIDWGEEE